MTVFIYDWKDYDASQYFDWSIHQQDILTKMVEHTQAWNKDINVQSKYMVLILWPDKPGVVNQDECRTSLKKAMALCEDCIK